MKNKPYEKCKLNTVYRKFDSLIVIRTLTYASVIFLLLLPLLFIYLNNLQFSYFIDEKFHIPQTLQYCKGNFFNWDPKITTLPALYFFSALILSPINHCTITYLRFINVICTYFNLFLIYKLVCILNVKVKPTKTSQSNPYNLYLTAWNIAFFPPLFFWFFLYYTDIFSVSLVLTMFLLYMHNRDKTAAFVGMLSVCVRQTNVIWVGFICIERCLTVIEEITKKSHLTDTLNVFPCIKALYKIFKAQAQQGIISFFKFIKSTCSPIFSYLLVLISFICFVIYNGGIVVGDRTAHVATIHITQIFYYSAFISVFSWCYLIPYINAFFNFIYKNIIISICFMCLIGLVIHYNTLVHPYILADNRHYTFYIWKNFMNRYIFFKYLLIPFYAFAIYSILKSLSHLRLLSIASYVLCVCVVLIPQLLLEPRYFIIPYIIFRLYQKETHNWQIIAETLTTAFINIVQFLIFINKSFNWEDEEHLQRISW